MGTDYEDAAMWRAILLLAAQVRREAEGMCRAVVEAGQPFRDGTETLMLAVDPAVARAAAEVLKNEAVKAGREYRKGALDPMEKAFADAAAELSSEWRENA